MGEFVDWTEQQYNSDRTRVRSSSMKLFFTPQQARRYYWEEIAPKPTVPVSADQPTVDHFVLGRLLHEYVLEGKQNFFLCKYRAKSDAWRDEIDDHDGAWALNKTNYTQLMEMREGLLRNPTVRKVLEQPRFTEDTILWEHSGILAKARLDLLTHSMVIFDLKSSAKTDRSGFMRQMEDLMYPFSGAFYVQALHSVPAFEQTDPRFFHIVVTKKPPFYSYVWEMHRKYIEIAHKDVDIAFDRLRNCLTEQALLGPDDDPLTAWPDRLELSQDESIQPSTYYLENRGVNPLEYDPFN